MIFLHNNILLQEQYDLDMRWMDESKVLTAN